MLVTVGDVKGVEVLQGPSLIWQPHSGDAFQDLIQLLLTRGLKTAQKTEKKCIIRTMVPFSINTVDSGNTRRDEHMCIPKYTGLPLGPAPEFTSRHPKSELCIDTHVSHVPDMAKSQHNTRSQVLDTGEKPQRGYHGSHWWWQVT